MTKPCLMTTTGLPASGKTTWAVKYLANRELGTVVRVSRDDIRRIMFQPGYRVPIDSVEESVTAIRDAIIAKCLRLRFDVIVDDTNLETAHIIRLSNLAIECAANFELIDFTDVPLEVCIERDKARDPSSQVGESVLRSMSDRLQVRLASDTDA